MVEDDLRLILDEYNSNFITYEISPGIYTFKDLFEALFRILQSEYEVFNNSVDTEFDDISMKTELFVRPGNRVISFDEHSFFSTILGFIPHWDYKHCIEYFSQKIVNLSTIDKIHLKCDVIDGSLLKCLRQTILFSFILNKPPGYEVFCQTETINCKKNKQFCFQYCNIFFKG